MPSRDSNIVVTGMQGGISGVESTGYKEKSSHGTKILDGSASESQQLRRKENRRRGEGGAGDG